jgi:hypothetical protein
MQTLYGMKVIESPLITEVPKLQLSHDFNACSEGMKKHMNDWLREKFGTYLPCYVLGVDTIAMHPKHTAMLKLQTKTYNAQVTGASPALMAKRPVD